MTLNKISIYFFAILKHESISILQVAIKFPEPNSGSNLVTVRGPVEDVEKAVKLLKKLSEEKQLSCISAEVKAKPQHLKFLIGRAGIHIQKIRDETGARIIFPGDNDANSESITIIGKFLG